MAGGLVGGLAQDLTALVIARVLIGVGTSAGYPSAMLLIRRRAEHAGLDAPPGSVLGGLVIAGMVTPAAGLPIGGALVGAWGWRTTFFVNVPLALVTLAMAARWIPRDSRGEAGAGPRRTAREVAARIDLAGIAGFGVAMAALLVFLMSLPRPDWIALAIAVVGGTAISCLAGSAFVLLLTGSTPLAWIVGVTLLFGITLGTGASANQTALYTQVPPEQIGTASGLFRTFGYLGSIASSAVIAIVFRTSVSDHGLHVIAIIMTAVSAVAVILTLADRRLMALARAGQRRS